MKLEKKWKKKFGFGKEKSVSDTDTKIGPWFWFQIPKLTWFWLHTDFQSSNWLPLIYICRHMQKSERVTNAWRSKKKGTKNLMETATKQYISAKKCILPLGNSNGAKWNCIWGSIPSEAEVGALEYFQKFLIELNMRPHMHFFTK